MLSLTVSEDTEKVKKRQKCLRQLKQAYEAKTLLEEEREKNKALTARIGKDYTNSSKSSSLSPKIQVKGAFTGNTSPISYRLMTATSFSKGV